jgi:hypothetical protein
VEGSPLLISGADIRAAIKGFRPGSAGGRDGLRPQHLKDLADGPASTLCDVLAEFANLVIRGESLCQFVPRFSGRLFYHSLRRLGDFAQLQLA